MAPKPPGLRPARSFVRQPPTGCPPRLDLEETGGLLLRYAIGGPLVVDGLRPCQHAMFQLLPIKPRHQDVPLL